MKLKSISRSALVLLLMLAPFAASNIAAKQKSVKPPSRQRRSRPGLLQPPRGSTALSFITSPEDMGRQ